MLYDVKTICKPYTIAQRRNNDDNNNSTRFA